MKIQARNKELIQQRYISLKDASVYLGLSPKTLYDWTTNGQIPAYKLGRVWRFDRQELDGFVHRSNTSSNAICYNSDQSFRSAVDLGQGGH